MASFACGLLFLLHPNTGYCSRGTGHTHRRECLLDAGMSEALSFISLPEPELRWEIFYIPSGKMDLRKGIIPLKLTCRFKDVPFSIPELCVWLEINLREVGRGKNVPG